METVVEEKLYKVARKKGSHINTKLNPDGSKAAIQFTDDGNNLNGPVNLIEVDEAKFVRTEYIPVQDEPRTLKEIVLQDVFVSHIESLAEYIALAGIKGLGKTQDDIKSAYKLFANTYFSEESQRILYEKLERALKDAFVTQA